MIGTLEELNEVYNTIIYLAPPNVGSTSFNITINDMGANQNYIENLTSTITFTISISQSPLTTSIANVLGHQSSPPFAWIDVIIPVAIAGGLILIGIILFFVIFCIKRQKSKSSEQSEVTNVDLIDLPDELESHLDEFFKVNMTSLF